MPHRLIHKSKYDPSDLADNGFVLQVSGNQDKPFEISFMMLSSVYWRNKAGQ